MKQHKVCTVIRTPQRFMTYRMSSLPPFMIQQNELHVHLHLTVHSQYHPQDTSLPFHINKDKITYQLVRIDDTKLKLLDALESDGTVPKVFRGHAERRCARLAGVGKVSSAAHVLIV